MDFDDLLKTIWSWAWGTLLTAMITAVLTMLLRHGRRWFRGARKFIRTGRVGRRRAEAKPASARPVKLTAEEKLALLLDQLRGRKPKPLARGVAREEESGAPLDLKF